MLKNNTVCTLCPILGELHMVLCVNHGLKIAKWDFCLAMAIMSDP